jgi:hypothetical protein
MGLSVEFAEYLREFKCSTKPDEEVRFNKVTLKFRADSANFIHLKFRPMKSKILSLAASTVLIARLTVSAQCYSVATTNYVADSSAMAMVNPDEASWSAPVPIGFPFCFYGAQYDSLVIGINGIVSFDLSNSLQMCPGPGMVQIPSAAAPTTSIMGPWVALTHNGPSGTIGYSLSGVSPNRACAIRYESMRMLGCSTSYVVSRIILHEGSNAIEMQILAKDSCNFANARATLGLQNQNGTMSTVVGSRNVSFWNANNEGWMITPICDVCSGVGVAESENANGFSVFPSPSDGNFTLQIHGANSSIASYDVIDISGRVVRSAQVDARQQVQFTLENPGMYFVRVYDQTNMMLKLEKIVVE